MLVRLMATCAGLAALAACQPQATEAPAAPVQAAQETAPQAPVDGEDSKPSATKEADKDSIKMVSPLPGARVTSPVEISGAADNSFFFEGVFPVELVADGKVLARGPAQQSGDKNWTDPGPVDFKSTLEFSVATETNAELVLMEDMPDFIDEQNDIRGPARAIRIPVVLVPRS
jgi:hypothetical protein